MAAADRRAAAIVARRLLRGQRSLEAAARRVEAEFPELGSSLINLVQLSEDSKNASPAFREAAIHQAAAQIGDLPLDRAPPASRAGGDCSIACRRPAIWPSRWRFWRC